jgi:hypothetical protein
MSVGGLDVEDTEGATRSGRKIKKDTVLKLSNRNYLLKQFAKIRSGTEERRPREIPRESCAVLIQNKTL